MYYNDKGVRENWCLFFILGHFIDFQYLLVGLLISLYIEIAFKIIKWKGGEKDPNLFWEGKINRISKRSFRKGAIIS
jgi:hypothetical protein